MQSLALLIYNIRVDKIRLGLHISHTLFHQFLIVESDSANAISWVKSLRGPWKMQFLFNEIGYLLSDMQIAFQHIRRSVNRMADCLAKQE